MNKNLIALSILLGVVGSLAAKTYFKPSPVTMGVNSQMALSKLASDMNKTLPMMIDKDTELVATVGLPDMFVYNYRLVNHAAQDLDPKKNQRIDEARHHQQRLYNPGNERAVSTEGSILTVLLRRQRSTARHFHRCDPAGLQGLALCFRSNSEVKIGLASPFLRIPQFFQSRLVDSIPNRRIQGVLPTQRQRHTPRTDIRPFASLRNSSPQQWLT